MNKDIRNRTRCQDFKYSPIPKKQVVSHTDDFFLQMGVKETAALNYVLSLSNTNQHIFVSQTTIANKVGVTRQTINGYLLRWEQAGLIHSIYRHMTSCVYRVSRWFANPEVRSRDKGIGYIFSALAHKTILIPIFALSLLMSYSDDDLTQLRCINNNLFKPNQTTILLERVILRGHTRASCFGGDGFKNKEGTVMKHDELVPSYIKSIRSLKLSNAGVAQLSVFSNEVLQYADKETLKYKPTKPFEYFYKTAFNYTMTKHILPKHDLYRTLCGKYSIQRGDSPLLEVSQDSHKGESTGHDYKQRQVEEQRESNQANEKTLVGVLRHTRPEKSNDGRLTFTEWLATPEGIALSQTEEFKTFERLVLGCSAQDFIKGVSDKTSPTEKGSR